MVKKVIESSYKCGIKLTVLPMLGKSLGWDFINPFTPPQPPIVLTAEGGVGQIELTWTEDAPEVVEENNQYYLSNHAY